MNVICKYHIHCVNNSNNNYKYYISQTSEMYLIVTSGFWKIKFIITDTSYLSFMVLLNFYLFVEYNVAIINVDIRLNELKCKCVYKLILDRRSYKTLHRQRPMNNKELSNAGDSTRFSALLIHDEVMTNI